MTLFSKKGDRAGRVILLASNTNNHTRGELNGLSLRGRPILFITRMMTDRTQRAKKVVSDSPGLVDFAIGLVIFVLNLPNGQVLFFWEIQITKDCNQSC